MMQILKNKNQHTIFSYSIYALIVFAAFIFFIGCNSSAEPNKISENPATIAKGKTLFTQYCSGCHNFRQSDIGPQLAGITALQNESWLQQFIKNPNRIIQSGDAHAQQLYHQYKTLMPAFSGLPDDDINSIIAYINTYKNNAYPQDTDTAGAIENPIPQKIQFSGTIANLQEIVQVPASSDSGKTPLARITKLSAQPQTGDLFILDLRGKLYKLENGKPVVYVNMAKLRQHFINEPGLATGFGSFAFHPDFSNNGLLYTTHSEAAGSAKADFALPDSVKTTLQWVLTEWKTDNPNASVFSGKARELLRIDMVSGIHGVQQIGFNPLSKPGDDDYGLLYIGVGDGGCAENGYPFLAHSKEKIWGTILRIDPLGNNSANKMYGIPSANPFVKSNDPKTVKETYAYGFRNPHRFSWTHTNQMIACNIGQAKIESVDYIKPGGDYGWPIREGRFMLHSTGNLNKIYPLPANDSSYHITYPVAAFDHDEGKAICGGFEYTGTAVPALKGKYVFGDIFSGRLFYINLNEIKQGSFAPVKEWKISLNGTITTLRALCGSERVDLHFGEDAKGELYILTKADGKVYRITAD